MVTRYWANATAITLSRTTPFTATWNNASVRSETSADALRDQYSNASVSATGKAYSYNGSQNVVFVITPAADSYVDLIVDTEYQGASLTLWAPGQYNMNAQGFAWVETTSQPATTTRAAQTFKPRAAIRNYMRKDVTYYLEVGSAVAEAGVTNGYDQTLTLTANISTYANNYRYAATDVIIAADNGTYVSPTSPQTLNTLYNNTSTTSDSPSDSTLFFDAWWLYKPTKAGSVTISFAITPQGVSWFGMDVYRGSSSSLTRITTTNSAPVTITVTATDKIYIQVGSRSSTNMGYNQAQSYIVGVTGSKSVAQAPFDPSDAYFKNFSLRFPGPPKDIAYNTGDYGYSPAQTKGVAFISEISASSPQIKSETYGFLRLRTPYGTWLRQSNKGHPLYVKHATQGWLHIANFLELTEESPADLINGVVNLGTLATANGLISISDFSIGAGYKPGWRQAQGQGQPGGNANDPMVNAADDSRYSYATSTLLAETYSESGREVYIPRPRYTYNSSSWLVYDMPWIFKNAETYAVGSAVPYEPVICTSIDVGFVGSITGELGANTVLGVDAAANSNSTRLFYDPSGVATGFLTLPDGHQLPIERNTPFTTGYGTQVASVSCSYNSKPDYFYWSWRSFTRAQANAMGQALFIGTVDAAPQPKTDLTGSGVAQAEINKQIHLLGSWSMRVVAHLQYVGTRRTS